MVLWSALTVIAAIASLVDLAALAPRRFRWLIVVLGVPAVCICLLTAFEHISLALPGSF